jgi:hypothetical protein
MMDFDVSPSQAFLAGARNDHQFIGILQTVLAQGA